MARRRSSGNGWVYILVTLMVLYNVFVMDDEGERRPRTQAPPEYDVEEGESIPGPRFNDPNVIVEALPPRNSQGTAFAISRDGLWLTARHVADGCRRLVLADTRGYKRYTVTKVVIHPRADVALLETGGRTNPLKMGIADFHRNQAGFHFGFPAGLPTAVDSRLLGRSVIRTQGFRRGQEPSLSWAEKRRVPERSGALGGLSGGPTLDDEGSVIGIAVAASRRRGRIESAAPASIKWLLRGYEDRLSGDAFPLTGNILGNVEQDLREEDSVMRVFCQVTQ